MNNYEDSDSVKMRLDEIEEQGYTILEDAFDPELADALAGELSELERALAIQPGANLFEGHRTIRIYNLLARSELFQLVPVHDSVLPVIEGVLDRGCLVSSLSSIAIDPGEVAQPIHADDVVIGLRRPHQAVVCNSMWALTDFTEENGATRIIPGSHKLDYVPEYGSHPVSIPAEMARGSVLIWHGSLWHGGGANSSRERRLGLAMNYCAGFIRQQENQQLGIPLDIAQSFSPRLKELAGYGTYRDLIGHIDKSTPAQRLFGVETEFKTVWDRVD